MKQKDMIYMLLAVVILLVAGYVVYTNLVPQDTTSSEVKVNVVGKIPTEVDPDGIKALNDPAKANDFSSPIEFSGLNNPAPFGR